MERELESPGRRRRRRRKKTNPPFIYCFPLSINLSKIGASHLLAFDGVRSRATGFACNRSTQKEAY